VPVRFYIDADLLGVAKVLATVRSDVTYPGDAGGIGPDGRPRSPCPIHPGDKAWSLGLFGEPGRHPRAGTGPTSLIGKLSVACRGQ
jgi:hypothetical protein